MESVRELIEQTLNDIKTGIETNMSSKGRNASGRSVRSLKIKMTSDTSGTIEGNKSFQWMERGRRSGKIPKNFTSIISRWIDAKGISIYGKSKRSAARIIAYSIAKHGTKLHRTGGFDDIYTSVINDNMKKLSNRLVWFFDETYFQPMKYE